MNIVQQKIQTFKISDRLLDFFLLFISARLAIIIERLYNAKSWHVLDPISFNFKSLIIIYFIWLILIHLFENDVVYRRISFWEIFKNSLFICFIGVTTTITIDFLLDTHFFKRSTIIFFGSISFALLLFKRGCLKYFLSTIREEGFDTKNILIIGSHKRAARIVSEFDQHREYGFKIIDILVPSSDQIGKAVDCMYVTGDMSKFQDLVKEKEIDEVFFAIDLNTISNIQKIFNYLDAIGVSYHMMVNESVHAYIDNHVDVVPKTISYYGIPMLSFRSVKADHLKLYIKHVSEKIFALVLLLLTLPILLLFGLLVKVTSRGPIFFKQLRVGLNGRQFYQYKLRSMVDKAEYLKNQYMHLNEQNGPVFKIKKDPRLTSVGKFMRKYSIDELPQLINILWGSMTLIGPRPLPVSEVNQFDKDYLHRRHSMKPGVTGLWQVRGRNKIKDFNKWVEIDLEYIDNWSFSLDIKIAFRTISTVLSGTGV